LNKLLKFAPMFHRRVIYLILSIVALTFASCSQYTRLQKSQDYALKYEKALEYYEKGDYVRALTLFDQVMPFYRGTEDAENIAFKYAYAYYYQKEYILASFYFDRFSKTYPRSERAEEALFMTAYCKYMDSPSHNLDQSSTKQAITQMQIFLNTYPHSERAGQANELIDELRAKLQKKDYEIAKLYYKMDRYQAAVTSFDILLNEYPDTPYREEVMYYSIKAYFDYANKSVKEKRGERYQESVDRYQKFISRFPDSKYAKEAMTINERSLKMISENN
jgi:outer membrane protein assembly factor BamD